MCSGFCLRIFFALFPAYVSCLGSYDGNMSTTNMQSVPVRTFPEMGSEVKQVGNLIDLPNNQDNHGHYDSYQKEKLFEGSSVTSDVKDCQTRTESDNQDNMIKPFASVPNYNLLGFGQPPSQYESNALTDVFKNVQPVSQLAYTSQGRSTLMETPKVLGFKTFKPSKSESSYEAIKSSAAGSSKIFAVQAPKHAYDRVMFKPQVSADALVGDPKWTQSNSILSQFSKQHGASHRTESFRKFQAAGSTYGPILMGAPVHSKTNPRKPSHGGLAHPEAKPSVVSSGPIVILQGSESTQGLGSTLPNSVKPKWFPSNVDFNQYVTPRSSQISSVALNVGGRHSKLWHAPLYNSMRQGQNSAGPKPLKRSGSGCRDDVGKYSVASSSEFRLRALESADGGKSVPYYESREDVQKMVMSSNPRKFQKTYNTQHNVVKSSITSSGEIRMMSNPSTVQNKTHSIKLQVTSKPNASSPEHRATFPSIRTALQYQPFDAYLNSRNVQPTTASPPQSGYKVFSSFMGTSYKPGSAPPNALSESRFSATKPSVADAIRVRLNKWPKSIFGNHQNQWASRNDVGALTANSGALQSVLPSSDLGHRQVQNVHDIITIPDMFGKGVIRRLSAISSSYRPASQNQAQGGDSSTPECDVTQNHGSGVGQQGPFQGVKYTSSSSSSQHLL
ncbi:uncharacterized protein zgc:175136 [Triplophysa rosa]|uniref:Uncharacterized protein n=1 Tax=Triplophysa rosa TaxID=992332 RepID=A0A9W7T3J4_TRIRA|nr:uncharacterized protein zgc:175136 [Triplophysa rosa]KAI7789980.1 hypothetical protein IRJ41_013295 [Triplophysa rosa]